MHSRREFLNGMTLAGTAAFLWVRPPPVAAEPPPETTRIKLAKIRGICIAPQYVAEELLRAEGFTDVQYVQSEAGTGQAKALGSGEVEMSMNFAAPLIVMADGGAPLLVLAGVHVGCFELFGNNRVRSIRDLKGKTVGVQGLGSSPHIFLTSMAAHVGLDPEKDINWVTHPSAEAMRLFVEGKIDAFLGFPPEPQALRAQKVGHVVVNSAVDRPWSQYFCCMISANKDFVRKHPVATKRAVRAILKATDLCALEPDRAAKRIVDRGFTQRYDYAFQTMKDVPYGRWREYDPEDTIRFYALRLNEARMIKANPKKLIADSTDWRFLNELRKELKG